MKRAKKMVLLLCVLAVMIGGYFGVQQLNRTESVLETADSFDLTAKAIGDLTGLSWTKDETVYSFVYDNDTWTTADQPSWPVLQSSVQTMAENLISLQANRKLENVKNLADYGLESPVFTVTASWKDGTQTTYNMGDATPFADGYYLSISGQDGIIYTIASSLLDTFNKTQKDLTAKEAIPSVSDASRLSVGSAFDAVRKETSITVDPDQLWYDTHTNAPLDGSQIDTLISEVKEIAWDDLVTANADEDMLAQWQLNEESAVAVTLSGGDESLKILLGAQNEDGDHYARLPGSAMVYTVESSGISDLLSASVEEMRVMTLLPMPYEQLASAEFITEKGNWQLTKPAETDTESTEDSTASEAGETVDPNEELKNLWKMVTTLKATGRPDVERAGDQVLSIRAVNTSGLETTVIFSEYSADSYQVSVDGTEMLLVSAEDVDALVRTVRAMH